MQPNIIIDQEFQARQRPRLSNAQLLEIGRQYNQARARERERAAAKRRWIASARRSFSPGPRQACCICGKYQSVAHAHHLTPLHIQAETSVFSEEFVWLCPTHHHGVHEIWAHLRRRTARWEGHLNGFTEEEKKQMLRLVDMGMTQ